MLKRLQRVQKACAAFALGKFATVNDLNSLKWLPVRERRELNFLKMTYKVEHKLRLDVHSIKAYNLRSSTAPTLSVPRDADTFQHMAATSFNGLPNNIRNISAYRPCIKAVKDTLFQQARLALANFYLFIYLPIYSFYKSNYFLW